ncbi:Fc.00g062620.m01.CDS01 [Cosmosporella sp. VM-42]
MTDTSTVPSASAADPPDIPSLRGIVLVDDPKVHPRAVESAAGSDLQDGQPLGRPANQSDL